MEEIFLWYYLIFVIPFGLASLLLLLMSIGTLPMDFDFGFDFHHDVDLDFDHDVDLDHDLDLDHGGHGFLKALSILGVGRVPLSILIMTAMFLWGLFGWISNHMIAGLLELSDMFVAISVAAASIGSCSLTAVIARFLEKILPTDESFGSSVDQLIGKVGHVIDLVDDSFGRVRVVDDHGTTIDVTCVTEKGADAVPRGGLVLLFNYDPETKQYMGQEYTNQDSEDQANLLTEGDAPIDEIPQQHNQRMEETHGL